MSPTKPAWGSRLNGIEGLRAVACVLVLITHVWEYDPSRPRLLPGVDWLLGSTSSGLTLFFVLSGFLLYRPFASAVMNGRAMPSARAYFQNRALRILPGYMAIFVLVSLVLGVAATTSNFFVDFNYHQIGAIHNPGVFAQDLFLVQGFTAHSTGTGIGTAWSLEVELIFYLVLPILAILAGWLASRSGRRTAAGIAPAGLLLVLGIVCKVIAWRTAYGPPSEWGATWHTVFERSFLCNADLFAFGMIAAVLKIRADQGRAILSHRQAGIASLALGLVFLGLHTKGHLGERAFTTTMALAFGLLLLYVVLPREKPGLAAVLEWRPLVYVGVISYSMYLWHEPLIFFLRKHGLLATSSTSAYVNVLLVFAVALVASTITYRLVEAPAMKRKARMTPRPALARELPAVTVAEATP